MLYLWDLSASGYGNDFYAAAVKSGTESWKALLFGSIDSANAITVDKPPAALWVMALSGRIFGFSSWSMLVPQALMGVGTVALVHAAVKRWAGPVYGLLAGLLVLVTPVAALMFRFNNPDALLTVSMAAAGYCVVRAIDSGRRPVRWLVGAGLLIGLAFLAKLMQGLLVLPAFALVYLVVAPHTLWTRVRHLLVALAAFVVGGGWFVALVSLWPADSRPYIGGSTNNSLWELALGYNGLGRIFGGEGNGGGAGSSAGGGGGGSMFGGATGITRMFGSAFGTEISWLLPSALILLVAGLVAIGRAPRTDRVRGGLILWGTWTVVTALVFSFMEGTIHPYYAIALAPGIAGTIAFGAAALVARRQSVVWRLVLGVAVIAAAVWSLVLLRTYASGWAPWLGWTGLVLAIAGACTYVALLADGFSVRLQRLGVVALVVAMLGGLLGTTGWTLATVGQAHTGSTPRPAPPASAPTAALVPWVLLRGCGRSRGWWRDRAGGRHLGQRAERLDRADPGRLDPGRLDPGRLDPDRLDPDRSAGRAGRWRLDLEQHGTDCAARRRRHPLVGGDHRVADGRAAHLVDQHRGDVDRWLQRLGRQPDAGAVPAVRRPGVDPLLHRRWRHGGGRGGGSEGGSSQITSWVESHFTATTVGGTTVYDLTAPTTSSTTGSTASGSSTTS
ncbi:hypothetical protein GCM10025862_25050 [Arsenicicoccus piscis]|uniref:Glycosyltransferase RgtA/B/C/D-like domain-containing protein n=1 Tax=Arsenicicoccus piscis TaxID=673954 RepID=A0ABQ6HPT2_9MICO|nr:hypothetical protein GCM10025862_25050 [Arsenicicoccus piscis]